jgi:hypothetical protein
MYTININKASIHKINNRLHNGRDCSQCSYMCPKLREENKRLKEELALLRMRSEKRKRTLSYIRKYAIILKYLFCGFL